MITLKDILEIENDEEILSFRCPVTGYLLWPLIRNTFIRFIMSDMLYETPLISENRSPRPLKAYASVVKAGIHNLFKGRRLKGQILVSSSGSHILLNGRYFNRLSDDFALAVPDKTVTLETLFTDWHWPFPRHNENVLFDAPILALSRLAGRVAVGEKHLKIADGLVKFVAQRAARMLDWHLSKVRATYLKASLARQLASLPVTKRLYANLFHRVDARILIREEGCYGGSSIINTTACECGLITAEYQHGAVSAGHDAYNFADILIASKEFKKTLPRYFLGYGKWWTDQINAPVVKLNIGNPQRTKTLEGEVGTHCDKRDVIVLGDGIETEKYLSLCTIVADEFGDAYRIVFRPHPMERDRVLRLYGKRQANVVIEWEKGLYEAFGVAEVVVSEVSTGLFEAVGLVDRIFLWDSAKAQFCYPNHPFDTFCDAGELVSKIRDGKSGIIDASMKEDFWAPNWRENYLKFLENAYPVILDLCNR